MIWDELTSDELSRIDSNIPVILPVAATEQHGLHLPLATDRIIGEFFVHRIHEILKDQVLILPAIAVGCSEHHLEFSGTLSVTHETLLQQMTDIFVSVKAHGFVNFVLFNSHGGNQAIGHVFREKIGYRHQEIKLHLMTWWQIAHRELLEITETGFGGTGHACEFETSLMLHIRPDMVRMEKIEKGYPNPSYDWAKHDMLHAPKVSTFATFKQMTKKGTFGDPTLSSAEKGLRIVRCVIETCTKVLSDIAQSR